MFQEPSRTNGDKKRADECDHGDHFPFYFGERLKHFIGTISKRSGLKQALGIIAAFVFLW
jgi:hypothetical protein